MFFTIGEAGETRKKNFQKSKWGMGLGKYTYLNGKIYQIFQHLNMNFKKQYFFVQFQINTNL